MNLTEKTPAEALALLEEMQKLMELKGENPFKIRAFEKAIRNLTDQTDLLERARAGTLTELAGIGKGISEVLTEFLLKGKTTARDELLAAIPPGLIELTSIPGLGPKKAAVLIEELGIQSLGELEYACRENRLAKLKGFGEKVQLKIMDGIQFQKSNQGLQRLVDVLPNSLKLIEAFLGVSAVRRVTDTGALRRRCEVLSEAEFLLELPKDEKAKASFQKKIETALVTFQKTARFPVPVKLHFAEENHFGYELAKLTGTKAHWEALGEPARFSGATEAEFYEKLKLPLIPPEARESGEEVKLARAGLLAQLLALDGVQGVFHNHTTRSDGSASLEEMVIAAKRLGYRYIGISDHSQSAFYAQGLKSDGLKEQAREIKQVQEKHPEIRIFWGIESDILQDGSLDYPDAILKKFDFVVASVHSRFQMDRTTMTERILEAIRNPHTRFLGHLTGRLLLGRKGYDLEMEKIIRAAKDCDVAIELNANPARLDIDWRWGAELRKQKTLIAINPDAHETAGLEDTSYGIAMARKALMPSALVINTRSAAEVEKWLKRV